jgi:hypothetical protein
MHAIRDYSYSRTAVPKYGRTAVRLVRVKFSQVPVWLKLSAGCLLRMTAVKVLSALGTNRTLHGPAFVFVAGALLGELPAFSHPPPLFPGTCEGWLTGGQLRLWQTADRTRVAPLYFQLGVAFASPVVGGTGASVCRGGRHEVHTPPRGGPSRGTDARGGPGQGHRVRDRR